MAGVEPTDDLRKELVTWVRKEIGRSLRPTRFSSRGPAKDPLRQDHAPHPAQDRRGRAGQLGGHLDPRDPAVVDDLVKNRQNRRMDVGSVASEDD